MMSQQDRKLFVDFQVNFSKWRREHAHELSTDDIMEINHVLREVTRLQKKYNGADVLPAGF